MGLRLGLLQVWHDGNDRKYKTGFYYDSWQGEASGWELVMIKLGENVVKIKISGERDIIIPLPQGGGIGIIVIGVISVIGIISVLAIISVIAVIGVHGVIGVLGVLGILVVIGIIGLMFY